MRSEQLRRKQFGPLKQRIWLLVANETLCQLSYDPINATALLLWSKNGRTQAERTPPGRPLFRRIMGALARRQA